MGSNGERNAYKCEEIGDSSVRIRSEQKKENEKEK